MNRNELLDLINLFKWDVDEDVENNLADLLAMVNYKNPKIEVIRVQHKTNSIWLESCDEISDPESGDRMPSVLHEFRFNLCNFRDVLFNLKEYYDVIYMDDICLSNENLLKLSLKDVNEYVMIPPDVFKEGVRYMIEKMVTSFMNKWSLFNRFMTKDEVIEEFKILNNRFDFIDTISYRGNPVNKLIFNSTKCKDINVSYNTNFCDKDFSVTLEN